MSDPQYQSNVWQGAAAKVDAGLRAYMLRVYNLMALAVGVTGLAAYYVASSPTLLNAVWNAKWVFFIAVLGLGWFAPKLILTKSNKAAHLTFWSYAALWGLLIAPMIAFSLQANVARAFFITSSVFAALSFYGYITKRDLAPLGKFLFMATIGLLVAVLVNVFLLKSGSFDLWLSFGIVLVFSIMTAYQTQQVKDSYDPDDSSGVTKSKAIFGAFILYGTFITLFIWILHILNIFSSD